MSDFIVNKDSIGWDVCVRQPDGEYQDILCVYENRAGGTERAKAIALDIAQYLNEHGARFIPEVPAGALEDMGDVE